MKKRTTDQVIEEQDFTVIWAAPILPGQAEAWRRFMQEIMGDRRQAYEEACRRLGIQVMRGWISQTSSGDIGVIAVIAPQPEQVMADLSESELGFDRWFRSQLAALQGLDLSRPPRMPPSELVLTWCETIEKRKTGGESEK